MANTTFLFQNTVAKIPWKIQTEKVPLFSYDVKTGGLFLSHRRITEYPQFLIEQVQSTGLGNALANFGAQRQHRGGGDGQLINADCQEGGQ